MLANMAVSITVLASGSSGNCTLVSSSATRLLVDAGLSCREIMRRMKLCGEDPCSIDAILITHEHSDHVAGLHVLAKKLKVPGLHHRRYPRQLSPLGARQRGQQDHAGTPGVLCIGPRVSDRRRHGHAVHHSA